MTSDWIVFAWDLFEYLVIVLNIGFALWFYFRSSEPDHMQHAIWHLLIVVFIGVGQVV